MQLQIAPATWRIETRIRRFRLLLNYFGVCFFPVSKVERCYGTPCQSAVSGRVHELVTCLWN